uniref:SJCHGC06785 protein n=1 Tax=Schistosoma japonicum TaxID=6182 RepID=Q5BS13_SCHJA|nr:SJCHGC06785 protein [Schistosoma japonicum]
MSKVKVGIIGGSGFDDPNLFKQVGIRKVLSVMLHVLYFPGSQCLSKFVSFIIIHIIYYCNLLATHFLYLDFYLLIK